MVVDVWMDGRMDGWMDGWKWMDGWMDAHIGTSNHSTCRSAFRENLYPVAKYR